MANIIQDTSNLYIPAGTPVFLNSETKTYSTLNFSYTISNPSSTSSLNSYQITTAATAGSPTNFFATTMWDSTPLPTNTWNVTALSGNQWTQPILYLAFDKVQSLRNTIKQNLMNSRRQRVGLSMQASIEEMRARESLRDMLSEADWRRYLTNGFIMVKGHQTGRWYQIFNKEYERIRVYEMGKWVENICIHSDAECPPTDHVINMKILAEIDENSLIAGGNKYKVPQKNTSASQEKPSNLIDLWANFKKEGIQIVQTA